MAGAANRKTSLAKIRKAGFVRVRINGKLCDLENLPEIDAYRKAFASTRWPIGSWSAATALPGWPSRSVWHFGMARVCWSPATQDLQSTDPNPRNEDWRDRLFSTLYACPKCDLSVAEIEPRTFSFNSPSANARAAEAWVVSSSSTRSWWCPDAGVSVAGGAVARGKA